MITIQSIEDKLKKTLNPVSIKIINDSNKHKHHLGNPQKNNTEDIITHLHIHIISDYFNNMNKITRSRLIYKILAEEMQDSLHAVSLKLESPEENNKLGSRV
ncbi:BolA family protein [Bartonella sp. DGB1]|uniref:BolA family protein n=1 Tax=Bartonella sp. DGB1 TaxID=3239807 RepID=UPI003525B10C